MNKDGGKNRFAGAAFDDSDDEPAKVVVNKTQKKKEERKITEKPAVKVNPTKMAEGGFDVVALGWLETYGCPLPAVLSEYICGQLAAHVCSLC